MTAPTDGDPAAHLREQLADRLQGVGLRSVAWRAAVTAVPRESFVPDGFFRRGNSPRGTVWTPVTPVTEGREAWLEEVYADETLVTQLDGGVHPGDVDGPVPGSPTSSSTLPSLVVRMLEDLDPKDGDHVLEIGTGTGYSTALMCHRLGSDHVTSIEYDPAAAARARTAITTAGYTPRLIQGDGLLGDPNGAPYDHLIATCSVRTIPDAWLRQVRPGGTILTTLSGWLYGSGLVRLTVGEDGTAEGTFLPGTVSFMIARPQAAPDLGDVSDLLKQPADERPARHGPEVLRDWVPLFLAQLAAPGAQYLGTRVAGGPRLIHAIDIRDSSFATLVPDDLGGTFRVHQGGPTRLWDDIEAAIDAWQAAGSPPQTAFTLGLSAAGQRVWLDTPDRPSWVLPT
ncbi:ATP-grasp peptide maturase system methyltransferase [Streptomyces katsurahamanus]|uniref:Protein-L-isoaspartate O-methyltransferase n=1 Tax=Streptomyces katsurahamanus TaxID=2577098 RepID=A0ABW9P245_9ACTN|nr:ATP-grasp peptide maturase system methyltransferase [Streptomyces katsurahamanus]MQS39538.1 methyltransferase domain-containing protein [Streptomyces katsurahamanus]